LLSNPADSSKALISSAFFNTVVLEAERLECLLFAGYDPQFEGDEPPGL